MNNSKTFFSSMSMGEKGKNLVFGKFAHKTFK